MSGAEEMTHYNERFEKHPMDGFKSWRPLGYSAVGLAAKQCA